MTMSPLLQDQLPQRRNGFRVAEIDRQPLLAAIIGVEGGRRAFPERRPPAARVVATPGILHFQHFGAKF